MNEIGKTVLKFREPTHKMYYYRHVPYSTQGCSFLVPTINFKKNTVTRSDESFNSCREVASRCVALSFHKNHKTLNSKYLNLFVRFKPVKHNNERRILNTVRFFNLIEDHYNIKTKTRALRVNTYLNGSKYKDENTYDWVFQLSRVWHKSAPMLSMAMLIIRRSYTALIRKKDYLDSFEDVMQIMEEKYKGFYEKDIQKYLDMFMKNLRYLHSHDNKLAFFPSVGYAMRGLRGVTSKGVRKMPRYTRDDTYGKMRKKINHLLAKEVSTS